MKADSALVEEVRKRAMALSARYDHDLRKYAEHLREIERAHEEQVVNQVTVVQTKPDLAPNAPLH
jgi:phosphoserine phosphatase